MKKKFKKLALHTETLRNLNEAELVQAGGASIAESGCTVACSVCTVACSLCTNCKSACVVCPG